jgi:tetratricopeptide (TPR) repeat protein
MDAQTLFRQGVMAVREGKDLNSARQLLLQSLKLDPRNELAWLWLSQTVSDPAKKLECVNRALKLNPANQKALELRAKLTRAVSAPKPPPSSVYAFDEDPAEPAAPPSARYTFEEEDEADYESTPAEAFVDAPSAYAYGNPDYDAAAPRDLIEDSGLRAAPTIRQPLTPAEEQEVKALLAGAEAYLKTGKAEDIENAIEQWVRILEIRVDHEVAIQNSVRHLARLGYMDDTKQLIWRAIDAGTALPSIYITAVDIAQRQQDHGAAVHVTKGLLALKDIDDGVILKVTDQMIKYGQVNEVVTLLEQALVHRPKSQRILIRLGELYDDTGRKDQAVRYFDRAARIKSGTKEAKAADKVLKQFTPIITDRERGNTWLAVREALAFPIFYLLLGWQDAGLNLAQMGIRWLGVLLSFVGGYLVISAVSSPQQQPLATWLGGSVPPPKPPKRLVDAYGNPIDGVSGALEDPTELTILPDIVRYLLFVIGAAILAFAFYLVFSTAIRLLFYPVTPRFIPDVRDLLSGSLR